MSGFEENGPRDTKVYGEQVPGVPVTDKQAMQIIREGGIFGPTADRVFSKVLGGLTTLQDLPPLDPRSEGDQ